MGVLISLRTGVSGSLVFFYWLYSFESSWVAMAFYVWTTVAFGVGVTQQKPYAPPGRGRIVGERHPILITFPTMYSGVKSVASVSFPLSLRMTSEASLSTSSICCPRSAQR